MNSTFFDAIKEPFDSFALDIFYRGIFTDPVLRGFYGDSGYANFGYWGPTTETGPEACDQLVDQLVTLLGDVEGRVLDVGCGAGATTRHLSDHFGPQAVSAINISSSQLAEAETRAPGVSFHRMDAAAMGFDDASFGAVVCVEAAFHFRTRRRFFEEAFRILEPGGSLALSDLLTVRGAPAIPFANFVTDQAHYRDLLTDVGFEDVVVLPARDTTWEAFQLALSDFITANRATNGSLVSTRDLYYLNVVLAPLIADALLAGARKPK